MIMGTIGDSYNYEAIITLNGRSVGLSQIAPIFRVQTSAHSTILTKVTYTAGS